MTQLIDHTEALTDEVTRRALAQARTLDPQQLDDLKHAAETLKKESPSPSRRVAAYIVADCCGEVQKERRLATGQ